MTICGVTFRMIRVTLLNKKNFSLKLLFAKWQAWIAVFILSKPKKQSN